MMRLSVLAAATLLIFAGAQQPPVRTLTVDLNVGGPNETRDEYTFAQVSGIAFDKAGRILVTDMEDNVVRVYDANGKFALKFGGKGQGPGDFSEAMSGVFGSDGLFWVRDEGNRRWSAFDVGADKALPKVSVRFNHAPPPGRFDPVGFDAKGNLISSGTADADSSGRRAALRTVIDRSGKVLSADTIRFPRGDSIGNFAVKRPRTIDGNQATVTWFYFQPYGPSLETAFAPNGDYARAVSSKYDVEWRNADGKVLRHLRRDITGPEVSASERKTGQESIDGFLKRSGMKASELPHGDVPARKAPIYSLYFDQLGRLWVQRRVAEGAPREADLYDATGKWIAIVRFPENFSPSPRVVGAMGNRILGTMRDTSSDVTWVVRMTMK